MTTKKNQPYIFEKDEEGVEWAIRNEAYWKEKALEKYNILLKRSDIPSFYWKIEWNHYKGEKSKENLQKALQFSKEFYTEKFDHVHLYLWSESNGSQKTAIACNIGKEAIKQGYKVKFLLAGSLIDMLMKNNGFNYNEDIYNQVQLLKQQDILIIDDSFSADKSLVWKSSSNNNIIVSEWDRFLREIVSSNTKIVMTSNLDPLKIKDLYSPSLYELVQRNFVPLIFEDNITHERKKKFDNLWDNVKN